MTPKIEHEKDAGWSWLVLAAVFLTQLILFGLLFCFGIYFVTLLDYFQCSKRDVAIVGSLAYGIKCLTALPASVVCRRFGCRSVVMCGGVLASVGCLLSYFARTLLHLYLSYGCLLGFGLGLVFTPSISVLNDYFDRYRFFATAFATVGSATGTFIFQPIFYRLIETYSWRGSMLINAGISLQIVALGSLMHSRTIDRNVKFSSLVEVRLFRNIKFWLLFANVALMAGSVYTVFAMSNSLAMGYGISKSQSALIASTLGLGNVCGRLLSSVVGQRPNANRPLVFALATALFTVATMAAAALPDHNGPTLAASLAVFGLGFGAMFAQLPGVVMDLLGGPTMLTNGLGYSMFAAGLGALTLPVVAGRIADKQGNVESAFYLAVFCSSLASCLAFLNVGMQWRQKTNERLRNNRYEIEHVNSDLSHF